MKELERSSSVEVRTISQLHLTTREKESIVRRSLDLMRPDPLYEDDSDANLRRYVEQADSRFEDLDGDGVPELMLSGQAMEECGGTGNCSLRIFRKQGEEYRLILNTRAQTLMVDRSQKKPLLVLYEHHSAMDGYLTTYSFSRSNDAKKVMQCNVNWNNWPESERNTPHLKTGVPTLESCEYP